MKLEPLKVLLVDDTPENLVALEALLRRPDIEIVCAASGAEALELLLVHEISIALLDIQMPDMDGFELAELMRGAERTKHVPIIFVTAGARDPQRVFQGYERGAVDFLYKPIDPLILTSKVEVFLELARQRRRLAQALQLNEMFVAILSHDLRNPLAAMMAGLDVLAMHVPPDVEVKILRRIRSSAKRMETMVADLLDLTRVRLAPGLGLARSQQLIDLRELVKRTIEELSAVHGDRTFVLEGEESCMTSGDPDRLLQLFSNLIGNAIIHGAAHMPITARIADCDRDAVVEVHNHGTMPREVVDTLFEPFQRPGRNAGGLGLGLYIAQQIAVAHGGDVEAASSDADGTLFTVRLPRARDPLV